MPTYILIKKVAKKTNRYEIWEMTGDPAPYHDKETMVAVYEGDSTARVAAFDEAVKMSRSYGCLTIMFSEG